jgi:hypothetical protein
MSGKREKQRAVAETREEFLLLLRLITLEEGLTFDIHKYEKTKTIESRT